MDNDKFIYWVKARMFPTAKELYPHRGVCLVLDNAVFSGPLRVYYTGGNVGPTATITTLTRRELERVRERMPYCNEWCVSPLRYSNTVNVHSVSYVSNCVVSE